MIAVGTSTLPPTDHCVVGLGAKTKGVPMMSQCRAGSPLTSPGPHVATPDSVAISPGMYKINEISTKGVGDAITWSPHPVVTSVTVSIMVDV
jgi:hypothetical protein